MSTFHTFKSLCLLRQLVATKDTTTDGAQASRTESADETPTVLGPGALMNAVEVGEVYLGVVIASEHYGVFVRLSEGTHATDPITGLAHHSKFPPDVEVGDINLLEKVAVRVDTITSDGPELVLVESVSDDDAIETAGWGSDEPFGENPLKSVAIDLLRLADAGESAERVVSEATDGDARYEVVVNDVRYEVAVASESDSEVEP